MLDTSKIPTKRVDGYYTHITNCITKIPQDIKLELNNGTITLKAGSSGYKCDGNFTKHTTSEDQSRKPTVSAQLFMYIDENNNFAEYFVDRFFSGNSAPTVSSSIAFWYDTTTKKMKKTLDTGGSWFESNISLPMALVTCDTTQGITSIDQVFNGFGYISSTIFALPGVEGLIPDGFNEDGSIKNIHCQIEEVQMKQTLNDWDNHWYVHLMGENLIEYHPWELYFNQIDKPMSVGQTAYWYNPNEKIVKSTDDFGTTWNTTRQVTPFLEVFQNGETITSIKPINVYENTTSKTIENKFKVVSELPSFPEVGVFYFVKE